MRSLLAALVAALVLPAASAPSERARVAAFYYPWYGNPPRDGGYEHWQQGGHAPPLDLGSSFFPARGPYSSSDPRVLAAQMRELAVAGVDEIVSSWWGRGSIEDRRLPLVAAAARAHGLDVGVHLEPYPGRTAARIADDVAYLQRLGVRDVYVYEPRALSVTDWAALNEGLDGVRIFAQTAQVGFAARAGFDGVYTYDTVVYGGAKFHRLCEQARSLGLLCAPSVGPGYDARAATRDPQVKLRRDGATYDSMWRAAIDAGADLVTITSYNEWNEGTQIEPAGHGGRYESYAGAWGLRGPAAAHAYLWRTAYWAAQLP
jgi:hypothetical protein